MDRDIFVGVGGEIAGHGDVSLDNAGGSCFGFADVGAEAEFVAITRGAVGGSGVAGIDPDGQAVASKVDALGAGWLGFSGDVERDADTIFVPAEGDLDRLVGLIEFREERDRLEGVPAGAAGLAGEIGDEGNRQSEAEQEGGGDEIHAKCLRLVRFDRVGAGERGLELVRWRPRLIIR